MARHKKMMKTTVSKSMITIAAKDFLQDSNKSSRYMKAVDSTIKAVMAATKAKIEQAVYGETEQDDSN